MLLAIVGGNLFSPSQWHKDFKVGLGLDLSSGTQLSMQAKALTGGIPTSSEMNTAKSIILSRVNASGNTGAQVQTEGNDILNVSVPGKTTTQTEQLVSETALLNFRQVLLYEPYSGTTTPSASTSPSTSPSASPSASASSTARASSSPSSSSTAKTSAKIVPAASSSASPKASSTASPKASTSASPSPSPSATSSTAPTVFGDQSLVDKDTLALFNKVTCTPNDTTKWKQQAGYTNPESYDNTAVQIVSCDSSGNKYALDVAKVPGTQIATATANLATNSNQWEVLLTFKGAGAAAYGALTSEQATKYLPSASTNENDFWLDSIAIVLDGNVISAPEVQGAIPGGNSQITGNFTQAQATQLANYLQYGSLPLTFTILTADTVSPSLGRAQLDGGLIAAAIGLFLVVVYSFLYYRGLGLVSVSSLIIAGTLALLAVILLSKYQNFALELSGIAGLIVAIGITADSFVVFFERLILVSDTVSFIAAVLLYYFSIGEVKGFAYTLGLTTIIDIIVVFLFTKPMVTLLARTKFYGNGHPLSGLDPARLGARAPWRSSVRRTTVRRGPGAAPRSTVSRNTTGEA
jgi:preprotein translocase subunit SecD